jgi:hypothetical protein
VKQPGSFWEHKLDELAREVDDSGTMICKSFIPFFCTELSKTPQATTSTGNNYFLVNEANLQNARFC